MSGNYEGKNMTMMRKHFEIGNGIIKLSSGVHTHNYIKLETQSGETLVVVGDADLEVFIDSLIEFGKQRSQEK